MPDYRSVWSILSEICGVGFGVYLVGISSDQELAEVIKEVTKNRF